MTIFLSSPFESRTKKYINAFGKISIFMAVFSALVMSIKIGLFHGIIAGCIISIIGTILMSLVLVPIDYWFTRKLPVESLAVRQERDIKLKGEFNSIYIYCVEVIRNIKGVIKVEKNDNRNIIGFTRTNMSSIGERISLELSQLDQETINIHITSRPIIKYTMLDYGKNYKNVECITNQLARYNA